MHFMFFSILLMYKVLFGIWLIILHCLRPCDIFLYNAVLWNLLYWFTRYYKFDLYHLQGFRNSTLRNRTVILRMGQKRSVHTVPPNFFSRGFAKMYLKSNIWEPDEPCDGSLISFPLSGCERLNIQTSQKMLGV